MMNALEYSGDTDVFRNLGRTEWLAWGFIPEELVVNKNLL
jgi:hypothetical protein